MSRAGRSRRSGRSSAPGTGRCRRRRAAAARSRSPGRHWRVRLLQHPHRGSRALELVARADRQRRQCPQESDRVLPLGGRFRRGGPQRRDALAGSPPESLAADVDREGFANCVERVALVVVRRCRRGRGGAGEACAAAATAAAPAAFLPARPALAIAAKTTAVNIHGTTLRVVLTAPFPSPARGTNSAATAGPFSPGIGCPEKRRHGTNRTAQLINTDPADQLTVAAGRDPRRIRQV